jgi:hypothetical protein
MTGWVIEYWSSNMGRCMRSEEHNTLEDALRHACDFEVQNKGDTAQRITGPGDEVMEQPEIDQRIEKQRAAGKLQR